MCSATGGGALRDSVPAHRSILLGSLLGAFGVVHLRFYLGCCGCLLGERWPQGGALGAAFGTRAFDRTPFDNDP